MTTTLADKVRDRLEDRRRDAEEYISTLLRRVGEERERLEHLEARLTEYFTVRDALEAAGFEVRGWWGSEDLEVRTTQDRLPDVYRVVGRLDGRRAHKDLLDRPADAPADAPDRVRVTLACVRHPFVTVAYERDLKPGDPCRVVEVEVPARVERQLLCGRS